MSGCAGGGMGTPHGQAKAKWTSLPNPQERSRHIGPGSSESSRKTRPRRGLYVPIMAIAVSGQRERRIGRVDAIGVLLAAVGVFLCALVLLPLGWLGWFSITDDAGRLTLANFVQLASDPSFVEPYATAFVIAAGVAISAC